MRHGKNSGKMTLFLSAIIQQGDELFSMQSRGKQCAFMSLSAILTAQTNPLSIGQQPNLIMSYYACDVTLIMLVSVGLYIHTGQA